MSICIQLETTVNIRNRFIIQVNPKKCNKVSNEATLSPRQNQIYCPSWTLWCVKLSFSTANQNSPCSFTFIIVLTSSFHLLLYTKCIIIQRWARDGLDMSRWWVYYRKDAEASRTQEKRKAKRDFIDAVREDTQVVGVTKPCMQRASYLSGKNFQLSHRSMCSLQNRPK